MANNAAVRIVQHIEEIDTKIDLSVKYVKYMHYEVVGFGEYNQLSAQLLYEVIQLASIEKGFLNSEEEYDKA